MKQEYMISNGVNVHLICIQASRGSICCSLYGIATWALIVELPQNVTKRKFYIGAGDG